MKTRAFNSILLLFLFFSSLCIAQTDDGPDSRTGVPGNWGLQPSEKMELQKSFTETNVPDCLLKLYAAAKLSGNESEKIRVGKEIQKYLEQSNAASEGTYEPTLPISEILPPFTPDWYTEDVLVHSGSIAYMGGFRQLDLKLGEDGWLYLAVNRRNVSDCKGHLSVYRSSNGGATWQMVQGAVSYDYYFGTISMLVEKRHATIDDSVRILVFYNRSAQPNFNDASLECVSFRRDGSAWYVKNFAVPAPGNKYEYPSACSDGTYWAEATYMHVVAREVTNAGTQIGIRHFLSTTWGVTYTNVLLNTGFTDMYPSTAYSEKETLVDSIYIAVERRISSTDYAIRAIVTSEWGSTGYFVYYITGQSSGTKYEKPCITIQQQQANEPKRILITCTKNGLAKYHASYNGGKTWLVDYYLGNEFQLSGFTWCSSDSLTAGTGYVMGCFVDQNGDSITVRRGVVGWLGTFNYKRNSHKSTGLLAPVCAIYKAGSEKWSTFAHAGQGPNNVYFDQESFESDYVNAGEIQPELPQKFELLQNYPNPFNPSTNIVFSIPQRAAVKLTVYDILGNEIAVLADQVLSEGSYRVDFDASGLSSGMYFYRLEAGKFKDVKKMILVK